MDIKPCSKCGGKGILKTTYDTEQVVCETCGSHTIKEVGDYYDEGFMDGSYVIPKWNEGRLEASDHYFTIKNKGDNE